MGDSTGGARDRDKAEKKIAASQKDAGMAPPSISGTSEQIAANIYRNVERDARNSERNLQQAIKDSSVGGKSVSYYKDQEKKMIDAIQSNPNLTNYQKVTQIQNIKAASDPMAVRSGYSLGERLAGAGSLGLRKMGENTPLTEADLANMSPEMRNKAIEIATKYQRPPVLINGQVVAMPPTMPEFMGDIGRAGSSIASGIMKASPYGMTFNILKDLYNKATGTEPKPETVAPQPELDYRDFLGRERTLDSQYGFSPLNSLTGIEGLPNAPMMYSNDISGSSNRSVEAPPVISPPVDEKVTEEAPSFLAGMEGGNITYPYGDVLVSYEDIIKNYPYV